MMAQQVSTSTSPLNGGQTAMRVFSHLDDCSNSNLSPNNNSSSNGLNWYQGHQSPLREHSMASPSSCPDGAPRDRQHSFDEFARQRLWVEYSPGYRERETALPFEGLDSCVAESGMQDRSSSSEKTRLMNAKCSAFSRCLGPVSISEATLNGNRLLVKYLMRSTKSSFPGTVDLVLDKSITSPVPPKGTCTVCSEEFGNLKRHVKTCHNPSYVAGFCTNCQSVVLRGDKYREHYKHHESCKGHIKLVNVGVLIWCALEKTGSLTAEQRAETKEKIEDLICSASDEFTRDLGPKYADHLTYVTNSERSIGFLKRAVDMLLSSLNPETEVSTKACSPNFKMLPFTRSEISPPRPYDNASSVASALTPPELKNSNFHAAIPISGDLEKLVSSNEDRDRLDVSPENVRRTMQTSVSTYCFAGGFHDAQNSQASNSAEFGSSPKDIESIPSVYINKFTCRIFTRVSKMSRGMKERVDEEVILPNMEAERRRVIRLVAFDAPETEEDRMRKGDSPNKIRRISHFVSDPHRLHHLGRVSPADHIAKKATRKEITTPAMLTKVANQLELATSNETIWEGEGLTKHAFCPVSEPRRECWESPSKNEFESNRWVPRGILIDFQRAGSGYLFDAGASENVRLCRVYQIARERDSDQRDYRPLTHEIWIEFVYHDRMLDDIMSVYPAAVRGVWEVQKCMVDSVLKEAESSLQGPDIPLRKRTERINRLVSRWEKVRRCILLLDLVNAAGAEASAVALCRVMHDKTRRRYAKEVRDRAVAWGFMPEIDTELT